MSVRQPAVAGMFYPSGEVALRELVEACFAGPGGPGSLPSVDPQGERRIVGLVCPHAGLIYSGSVAAWAYHRLAGDGLPDVVVLVGPNHRSYHPPIALSDDEAWRTPLGEVVLDSEVTMAIRAACPTAEISPGTHASEHSLEVQLPFIQYLSGLAGRSFRIVPVTVSVSAGEGLRGGEAEAAEMLGTAIAGALRGKDAVVIASTDFSHYVSADVALRQDTGAISRILHMDADGLIAVVMERGVSMCGALPTAVVITACRKLGGASVSKLAYATSGDVTGDRSSVVGYGAFEIDR